MTEFVIYKSMDYHVKEYYRQYSDDSSNGNFHKVIALHEAPDISWKELSKLVPSLPKGWEELAHLPSSDRIEFTEDFWRSKIPYRTGLDDSLGNFFGTLDDIGIYITQKCYDDPFAAHLVYSFKDDGGFFRGEVPAAEKDLAELKNYFPGFTLPVDYLAFLQIHDGFCKTTDCTGIVCSSLMPAAYESFQAQLANGDPLTTRNGVLIDPKSLIPFYESFGMPFYQCFWADWYPEDEMGNVYFSGNQKTITEFSATNSSAESMAFPTFTDWLMFYLERLV